MSIHIKKENRGKFGASAKRAGMGTQEYARHILANKDDYSSIQVKRAAFAKGIGGSQIKKHKHENGGILKAQGGLKIIKRVFSHIDDVPKSKLTYWERMGIPKGERNWDTQMGRLRKDTNLKSQMLAEQLRAMHFAENAKNNKLTWVNSNANWDYAPVEKPLWIPLRADSPNSFSDIVEKNTPVEFFHGTTKDFNVFDYNKAWSKNHPHFFFSTDSEYIKEFFKQYRLNDNPIIKRYYLYSKNPQHITKNNVIWDLNGKDEFEPYVLSNYLVETNVPQYPKADSFYGPDLGKIDLQDLDDNYIFPDNYPTEIAIPHNTHIKLASPFVYDDNGHFIKLSKRDDFTNPDTRYNKGGKL